MGTFARIFAKEDCEIPESKREEFAERVEKVFRAGGMMKLEWNPLFGKSIQTISFPSISEGGMNVCYNYFEDDIWGNAGFNKEKCYVWSNKIGSIHFHQVVVAAYVLEEQYRDGVSVAFVDGEPVTSRIACIKERTVYIKRDKGCQVRVERDKKAIYNGDIKTIRNVYVSAKELLIYLIKRKVKME